MKILITGSHGQLGNELQTMLRTGEAGIGRISDKYAGCEIIAVDVEDLDITDTAAVDSFVGEKKPDIIINCAAANDATSSFGSTPIRASGAQSLRQQKARSTPFVFLHPNLHL